jgi:DNA repair exonuclease SbcCD ATPase subunit
MKTIKLKKISIQNFKGIKDLTIEFKDKTVIEGKNGSGKTSVFDAYSWLLFGKNSQNQTDFGIKCYDENNNIIHNLEHSVEGTLQIDEIEVVLKRVLREKWTKKRGSENSELTGNETIFFINEVPKSLSEYKAYVDTILIEESQRILSNPLYFNQTMKWQDRRNILSKLAGEITNDLILSNIQENYRIELEKMLSTDKTLEDYKKEFTAKRKKIKDELDLIPSRIDEANRSKPESKEWSLIERNIEVKTKEIAEIESQIEDISKQQESHFEKISEANKLKFQKEQELVEVLNSENLASKKELNNSVQEKSNLQHIIQLNQNSTLQNDDKIKQLKEKIDHYTNKNNELRKLFETENAKEFNFDSTSYTCNTCQREYDSDKIEEIKNNSFAIFKQNQAFSIESIRKEGLTNKDVINKCQEFISEIEQKNKNLEEIIASKNDELKIIEQKIKKLESESNDKKEDSPKVIQLKKEISEIVIPDFNTVDNSTLKFKKSELQAEIDTLKSYLHDKNQIIKANERISELESQQRNLAQEIASFEKQEIAIENYNSQKNNLIEKTVNDKFSLVKFKLFETQMNGGINEICEATVNGVLYNDLNTAMKINAGIDVINVLSVFFGVNSVVFLDNRESTTNIIDSESQIISLFVNPNCETLKIN